ncbi:Unknown protein sequence [Pseudomonas amygdali pv. sesami]|nr:Unknown protein sequence [Pseudomonas amygdali pv. sesami]
MVLPAAVASVAAEAVIASETTIASKAVITPKTAIAAKAVVSPAITRWASRLVVAWHWRRRVITRCRGVVAWLGVIAWLRRYIDALLLIVGGAVAIVVRVSATDDGCRLRVHIGFVVTRACVATGKEKGQQRDKQGSSIHGGLLDRDWHESATLIGVRQSGWRTEVQTPKRESSALAQRVNPSKDDSHPSLKGSKAGACRHVSTSCKDATKHFKAPMHQHSAVTHQHKAVSLGADLRWSGQALKNKGLGKLAQISLDEWRAGVNTGSRHHNLQ